MNGPDWLYRVKVWASDQRVQCHYYTDEQEARLQARAFRAVGSYVELSTASVGDFFEEREN
ncbi:hypothetical protein [Kitasatospora sp. NPDC101183]|uniref:hypothetical protein n=1 Tax=Kitasatospora sp. NPDC101183 TaxID=3364100 RepID=UPI003826D159